MPEDKSDKEKQEVVDKFLEQNPMFAIKYAYENFSWPCYEDKNKLVAVFRIKNDNYRIRLSVN